MPRDLCLAIEISNPSAQAGAGVALARVDTPPRVLGVENLAPERRHDDDLMPAIDRLFRRLGRAPKELALVAVSIGPGGFTSLRISIAAAKMICEATGCACAGVPSAEVVSRRVGAPGPLAVALSSKNDTAFISRFSAPGKPDGPGYLADAAAVSALNVPL